MSDQVLGKEPQIGLAKVEITEAMAELWSAIYSDNDGVAAKCACVAARQKIYQLEELITKFEWRYGCERRELREKIEREGSAETKVE